MTAIPNMALCGCLLDVDTERMPELLRFPGVNLLEWRLDAFLQQHSVQECLEAIGLLPSFSRHPLIATNRPKREGGGFEGTEEARMEILRAAAQAGVEWIDLEEDVPTDTVAWFKTSRSRVLLSHHDFSGTPPRQDLRHLVEKMARKGADVLKIATLAHSPEDNLRVVELIPFGRRELGIDVIAFCMDSHGRWSRFVSLFLGSPWTYVRLPGQPPAAPGQFSVNDMRAILDLADPELVKRT